MRSRASAAGDYAMCGLQSVISMCMAISFAGGWKKGRILGRAQKMSSGVFLPRCARGDYSTVTDFARLRGLSTSVPLSSAAW